MIDSTHRDQTDHPLEVSSRVPVQSHRLIIESEPTLLDKECVLLAVLDREKRSAPKRHYDYKIRYRHGNKLQEEWMDYKTLYKFFDRPTFRLHVQQYIQNPVISLTDLSRDDKRKRQEEIEKSKGRGGLGESDDLVTLFLSRHDHTVDHLSLYYLVMVADAQPRRKTSTSWRGSAI